MHARWNDGVTLEAIAREFKVTRETVRLAVRLTERKAMWQKIDRHLRSEYLVSLRRVLVGGQ